MAVNKVVYGNNTLIDITDTTATADKVQQGYDFYDAAGVKQTGTLTSGGSAEESDPIRFYDYDGTLLYSYKVTDFLALESLPANPTHQGLIAQGWNWSLSDAKAYITNCPNGELIIGQMYTTDTGDTRIYINIDSSAPSNRRTFYVRFTSSVAYNVTLDWGDGTVETKGSTTGTNYQHTYANTGEYVIKLTVKSGTISFVGTGTVAAGAFYSIYGTRDNGTNSVNKERIKKVEIGNNVASIGQSCFNSCYALELITISSSVTSVGTYAFGYCYSLKSLTIPNGVTSIGSYAFENCRSSLSISIPNSLASITERMFDMCRNISSITIPNGVTSIGSYAFGSCASLLSIQLPNSLTTIGSYAFRDCKIRNIVIPNLVTNIESDAFYSCYSLKSIVLPSSLTSIASNLLAYCYCLSQVSIPNTVTAINSNAFYYCYAITSITIPSNVSSIGANAFQYCYGLSEIHLQSTVPPTLANTNAFSNNSSDRKFYVPYSADHSVLNAYKEARNWSTYSQYIVEESAA